jgi:hypothetical protein
MTAEILMADYLMNFGVLGLWVLYLIYEKAQQNQIIRELKQIIKNNTIILNQCCTELKIISERVNYGNKKS